MKFNLNCCFIFWGLLTVSCSPYNRLINDFNRNKSSVQYLHTTKIVSQKKNIHLSIAEPTITEPRFKGGEIKKKKIEVIPLLIYNGWNYTYECAVGKNQIKENMTSFIQSSLVAESNRSGIYRADTSSRHPYMLEIQVDSLRAGGTQNTTGFFAYLFFFGFYSNSVKVASVPAYCRFHYRLRKGDEILLDSYVSNYAQLDFLKPYPFSAQTINRYFKAHLVDMMSQTIKLNIEQIVQAVNIRLSREPALESSGGQ